MLLSLGRFVFDKVDQITESINCSKYIHEKMKETTTMQSWVSTN